MRVRDAGRFEFREPVHHALLVLSLDDTLPCFRIRSANVRMREMPRATWVTCAMTRERADRAPPLAASLDTRHAAAISA